MTDSEFLVAASWGGLMAMFLGDEQKTPWEPYHVRGVLHPGPDSFFADSIKVKTSDGEIRTFPFGEGDGGSAGQRLVYAGVQCYLDIQ